MSDLFKLTHLETASDGCLVIKPQKYKKRRGLMSYILSFSCLFVLLFGIFATTFGQGEKATDLAPDIDQFPDFTNIQSKVVANPLPVDFSTTAENLSILLLHTLQGEESDFYTALQGLPNVASVDNYSGYNQTPDVAYLSNYDIVVVASNYPWNNQTLMGDVLADYVDAGGKVCLLVFTYNTRPGGHWFLLGRITEPGYNPIANGPHITGQSSAPAFAVHPITLGLTNLTSYYCRQVTSTQGGGISLGTYSNGYLVGAVNASKPVVAINAFPHNGPWGWGGDLIQMMGNTFDYLMNVPVNANNDSYSIDEDTELAIVSPGVLGNDDGTGLSASLRSGPSNGTLSLNGDGSFTYMPNLNYHGPDQFTYLASNSSPTIIDFESIPVGTPVGSSGNPLSINGMKFSWIGYGDYQFVENGPGGGHIVVDKSRPSIGAEVVIGREDGLPFIFNSLEYGNLGSGGSRIDVYVYYVGGGSYLKTLYPTTTGNTLTGADMGVDGVPIQSLRINLVCSANGYYYDNLNLTMVDEANVNITVNSVEDPPVMEPISDITVNETETVTFSPVVSDGDDDPVLVSYSGWMTTSSYTTTYDDAGVHTVTVSATDGKSTVSQDVSVTVLNVNRPPFMITAIPDITGEEGDPISLTVQATDPDGDHISYSFSFDPEPNVSGVINITTGEFSWTPGPADEGTYTVTFTATDDGTPGKLSVSQVVTIVIGGNNSPPVLEFISDKQVNETQTVTVFCHANDPDPGDIITYSVDNAPGGSIDPVSGTYTWTTTYLDAGVYHVTFKATDNGDPNLSDKQIVQITINNVNRQPYGQVDAYSTDEDVQLIVQAADGVLANDTDEDPDDVLTAQLKKNVEHGTLKLNADGSFTYLPNANWHGTDGFEYVAYDGELTSVTLQVTLTVDPVNDHPIAVDDAYDAVEDTKLTIAAPGVLANDSDPVEGSPVTAVLKDDVSHGTLALSADGAFEYTPDANYNGTDQFTYYANDGTDNSDQPATVIITIAAVNDAPVALDGGPVDVVEDGVYDRDGTPSDPLPPLVSDVDFGMPDETHTYSIAPDKGPSHGVIAFTNVQMGTFTYTPEANYTGPDKFTYRVTDAGGLYAEGTITFNVTPVNDPPVATGDEFDVEEDGVHNGDLKPLVSDIDFELEGDVHTYDIAPEGDAAHGDLTINANGTFSYEPDANYNGEDEFTYRVTDKGGLTATATVSINVTPVDDAPVAVNDPGEGRYPVTEDTPLNIDVLYNDYDYDTPYGDVISILSVSHPAHGTAEIVEGKILYTPDENYFGDDQFTYMIQDNDGTPSASPATVLLTVNPVNDAPYFVSPNHSNAIEDQFYSYTPQVKDYENDAITYSLEEAPEGMNIDPLTGTITWTPTEGVDVTVLIIATDNGVPAASGSQEFTIDVAPVNDVPKIDPISDVEVDEDPGLVTVPMSGIYGGDAELKEIIKITATSSNPGLIPDPTVNYTSPKSTGNLTFTPLPDQNGSATITVTVTDDNATPGNPADDNSITEVFVVTVNPVNDAPVITTESLPDATEDVPYSYTITATDVEGNTLTWSLEEGFPSGMTINPTTGLLAWTPPNGVPQVDITVKVADNGTPIPQSTTETFTLHVTPVNDPPVVSNIPDQKIAEGSTFATINLDEYVTDIDNNDEDILWAVTGNSELTITIDINRIATITIPDINWNGFETVKFTASDGEYSAFDYATFTVTAVNDAPVITSVPPTSATEDVEYTYNPSAKDVENDLLTWTLQTAPLGMTIDAASGAITWTPAEGVTSAPVTIRVTDNGVPNMSGEQSFTIEVQQVNDAPHITSTPVLSATEEVLYTYDANATDPDFGDILTWSLIVKPEGMNINTETGVITWTPVEGVTSAEVTVRVTDNGEPGLFDEQSYTIAVTQVNDAPVITSIAPIFAEEDKEYTYYAQATDQDIPAQTLTWSLTVKPVGMTINPANGAISWTPLNGVTTADVTVRVTDNGTNPDNLYAEQSFTITVKPTNDAPVITTTAPITAVEDEMYAYNPKATDEDGDILTWSLPQKPKNMSIDAGTGEIRWTPLEGEISASVTVRVTDNGNPVLFDEESFTITVTRVNDAPVITSGAPTKATEEKEYTYSPTAEDVDLPGDELTWTLEKAPAGMTIDAASGAITWTPAEGVTSADVTVRVTDNGTPPLYDEQSYTITVTPVNDAPTITSAPPLTATEDIEYAYNPTATDPDNIPEQLTWSLTDKPEGMFINSATGAIRWTPGEGVLTSGEVTLVVTDPDNLYDEQTFIIKVTPVNDAPVIMSVAPKTATEDVEYVYEPEAKDIENNMLTWTLQAAPAGMTIDPVTGKIAWTPLEGVTSAPVTVRVTDNGIPAMYDEESYTITVTQVNDAPKITSEYIATATEDVEYVYDVEATDVDLPGDVLTYSLILKPEGMEIDANTGVITWTPLEGVLSGKVTVRVTDNGNPSLFDEQNFIITVTPVNDAPVITSEPVLTATEEVQYSYNPVATDIEGNTISWSLTSAPDGMTINPSTGAILWTPVDGIHSANVVIRVDDDGLNPDDAYSTQEFTITATPVNDLPTIDEIENIVLTEDDPQQVVTLTGIDDGDLNQDQELTITAVSNYPDRIHNPEIFYTQGESEGTLVFTPDPNANGVIKITVTVEDEEGGKVSTEFNVEIIPVNDAPVMNPIASPAPVLEDAGVQVLTMTGINDGDPEIVQALTVTATSSDINIIHNPIINLLDGTLTYTPVPNASGKVIITVTLTDDGKIPDIYNPPSGTLDGEPATTVYTFEAVVLPVNDAPLINQVAKQTVPEDETAQQVVNISGIADGDPDFVQNLTVTAATADISMITGIVVNYTPNNETGTLRYNVVENASGTASITVTVTDNGGTANGGVNKTEMTFNVEITPSNDAPVVLPIEDQKAYTGVELVFTVETSDPDQGDVVTIAQPLDLPEGAVFVDNGNGTGTFTWTPAVDQLGDFTVTFIANDGELNSAPVAVNINVEIMSSTITVTGLDEDAHVYIYATSGWFGKWVFDGNSSVDVLAGNYLLCVRQDGKRTEYIPVTVAPDENKTVEVTMYNGVPVLYDAKQALKDNNDDLINVGEFSSASLNDIDKDGDKDLIIATENGTVYIYNYNGTAFELAGTYNAELNGAHLACIRLVDVNEDNTPDILYGLDNGQIRVYNSEKADELFYTAEDGLTGFDLVDVDIDHSADLIIGYGDGTIDIDMSNGSGGWLGPVALEDGSKAPLTVNANAAPLGMDMNGDGVMDLLAGNEDGHVQWFQNNGSGEFTKKGYVNAGGEALAVSGNAALSFSYGEVGALAEAVVTDDGGNVYKTNVVLQGDITRDGKVDIFDLTVFGLKWGLTSESPDWNGAVNFKLDGNVGNIQKIDIFDLTIFGMSWGLKIK